LPPFCFVTPLLQCFFFFVVFCFATSLVQCSFDLLFFCFASLLLCYFLALMFFCFVVFLFCLPLALLLPCFNALLFCFPFSIHLLFCCCSLTYYSFVLFLPSLLLLTSIGVCKHNPTLFIMMKKNQLNLQKLHVQREV
jgi:hypothetical protein